MIFSEKTAEQFRCCGPEGCGSLPMMPSPILPESADLRAQDLKPGPLEWVPGGPPVVISGPRYCIGAKCAAWTWVDGDKQYHYNSPPPPDSLGEWKQDYQTMWERPHPARRGGCGIVLKVAVSGDIDQTPQT